VLRCTKPNIIKEKEFMNRSGFNNAWRYFCVLVVIVFGLVAIIGSSGSSSGGGVCGFNDWAVDTPKDLLGTSCGPDANTKDIFYINGTADPDVWYGGNGDGPSDANGYPTQIELSSAKERT
jgi:hypothetical protein